MNFEKKYNLLKKQNEDLQNQLDEVRLRLFEKEDELDADELRQEYLEMLDIFYKAIEGIRDVEREFYDMMHEVRVARNEFEKEVKDLRNHYRLLKN